MKGFLTFLLCVLVFIILYPYFADKIDEWFASRDQKKALLRERRKLTNEIIQKEILRAHLERKLKFRLFLAYTLLISTFITISLIIGGIVFSKYDFTSFRNGIIVFELALFIVTPYVIRKPIEFKYILTECAPFLKKKVYGEHINIEEEIKTNLVRINEIDQEIAILNRKLAINF